MGGRERDLDPLRLLLPGEKLGVRVAEDRRATGAISYPCVRAARLFSSPRGPAHIENADAQLRCHISAASIQNWAGAIAKSGMWDAELKPVPGSGSWAVDCGTGEFNCCCQVSIS